ncbi:protein fantom-like [Uloborus diversus]|uniref:protein fantom-like n=1 Tax=Uloborus diversus TaxID=327109 RepID=UPI00240A3864|nr:protein fantom-like [Uloborus diversus]
MDDMDFQFKAEQKKNLELLGELQKAEINAATTIELQERIKNIQRENEMLRETNDKLIKSTLAVEKERSINQMEDILKEKISNLEASLQFQIKEKNAIEQEYSKEKEIFAVKEEAHTQLKDHFNQVKSHLEELEVKVNVLKSQDVSFDELGEALNLLKLKKDNKISFVDDIPQAELDDLLAKLEKSELDHVETVKELHNIRDLLMTQYDVNKASQIEVKALTEKLDQQEKEFAAKVEEYSHLLDLRAARIQKLEKQLNDIAYGTKSFTIPDDECDNEMLRTETLSRGENIFEIHIIKIDFNNAGKKKLGSNPNVFMTWNFYEFELQSTPVVSAQKPSFNFTAQYNVQVDDYFLCYLHENAITLELHECFGVDYKTVATSQLHFSDIISKSVSRIHGTQSLINFISGVEDSDISLGSVEFWVRLKVPMEETFRLFKEKLKALKYIQHNKEMSSSAVSLLKQPVGKDLHVNELHIKIIRGLNLSSRQKDIQPSTFCAYKFYDLPDQYTVVIPASNNPEFSDHRTFSLYLDHPFEKYIRTENLFIYVFDDNEPDITSYIGRAEVPLHPLSQNQPIKGLFQLKKNKDLDCGSIEILIYWQYDYTPFSSENVHFIPQPQRSPSKSIKSSSSEEEIVSGVDSPKLSLPVQPPVPKPRRSVPSKPMTSTPLIKKLSASSSSDDVIPGGSKQMLYEDVSDEEKENFSDEESDNSTDDDKEHSLKSKLDSGKLTTITITVSYLILNEDAAVLADDSIKMLYVEYRFLDYPLEELETPFSLPKVEPPEKINFNFEKVFQLKPKDIERWNLLCQMLFSESPEASLIKFTVVSEPPSEEDDLECEDLGFGYIDLCEVLKNKRNLIGEDIVIYDAKDNETQIGRLNITIKALDALSYVKTIMES